MLLLVLLRQIGHKEIHFDVAALHVIQFGAREFLSFIIFVFSEFIIDITGYNA
jgi:hypothetical protein